MHKCYLIAILMALSLFLEACSNKDALFDDSRKCTYQLQDEKDAFGKVLRKAPSQDECPTVEIDPCLPQLKNPKLVGEVTDDTTNSVVVCPEVKDRPVLPTDDADGDMTPVDLSRALKNEDLNADQASAEVKSAKEPEEISIPKVAPLKTQKVVVLDQSSKQSTKKEISKSSPPKKTVPHQVLSKKKMKSKNHDRRKVSYKIVLGPFYSQKSYVPYKVKVELNNHIRKLRSKIKRSSNNWLYQFIAYYPNNASEDQKKHYKSISMQRIKELMDYAVWKEDFSMSSFQLIMKPIKNGTKNTNNVNTIILLITKR